jgi:hypothetical protein
MTMEALAAPYRSIEDVIDSLTRVEQAFLTARDRRGVFATAYLNMTKEVGSSVGGQIFLDSDWVSRYAICFANLYRTALLSYERGDYEAVPKPWMVSFETSRQGKGLLLQDLLLGVNAHINHDLALALVEVSIDPERPKRRQDHFAVNESIRRATDPIQEQVATLYGPALKLLDHAFGRLDEDVTNFSIEKARRNAWVSAVSLVNARGNEEAAEVRESISDRASLLAKLILKPSPRPGLLQALQRLERRTPWWQLLANHF